MSLEFWQNLPQKIDPVFLRIGAFEVRYYGLMYAAAFLAAYFLLLHRIQKEKTVYSSEMVQSYLGWALAGALIGGRLGYVFLYDFAQFAKDPLSIILPFSFKGGFRYTGISGMSYHGGLVGVLAASVLFCRRKTVDLWDWMDFTAPAVPLGYTFGRIGNFLNGELYGRATSAPWGMYFPQDLSGHLRHPSQLYEAFFEGIFMFAVLWSLRNRRIFRGFLCCAYLIGYGAARFCIEFTREPDAQLGFVLGPFTMGQVLCLLMIAAGTWIYTVRYNISALPPRG